MKIKNMLPPYLGRILLVSTSVLLLGAHALAAPQDGRTYIEGIRAGEQFGLNLVRGDFNNDGIDDLAVASPFYSDLSVPWRGRVTIIWGGSSFNDQETRIYGHRAEDQFGSSMTVGDLNADGIDDLIVSSHQADSDEAINNGSVYVFWGASNFDETTNIFVQDSPINISGTEHNARLGLAMATGDVNGDNIDDLVLSAPTLLDNQHSYVYALFGSHDFPRRHIFEIGRESNVMILGPKADFFGSSIEVADMDNDGIGDFIIGAYRATEDGLEERGKTYFIKGRSMDAIENQRIEYDLTKYPHLSRIIYGKARKEWFGFSLRKGDINNDKIADIVVSSFSFLNKNEGGKMSVIYGDESFFDDATILQLSTIRNEFPRHLIGASTVVTSFLKSGTQLLFSAITRTQTPPDNVGKIFALSAEKIADEAELILKEKEVSPFFTSEHENTLFGSSITVGDFNNDKKKDIAIGAPYFGDSLGTKRGQVTVLWGGEQLESRISNITGTPQPEITAVTRGEYINQLVDALNIREREDAFLKDCDADIVFCLLGFSLQTKYAGFALEPELSLYPDIADYPHKDDIVLLTKLGLVHGYMGEDNSPFKPNEPITKMQAIKVMLGAMNELQWRFKYELKEDGTPSVPFQDVNPDVAHMWWYPRYIQAALKAGIIRTENYDDQFGPDDPLSTEEFKVMLEAAKARVAN